MSILVRDMEMPTRCLDCKFMIGGRDNDDCILQSAEQNEKANTWDDLKANCPLIYIPHGDLIDRNELMVELMDSDLDHLQRDDWKEVIQIVVDAPTIIGAEGSDE